MKLVLSVLMISFLTSGCSHNSTNTPSEGHRTVKPGPPTSESFAYIDRAAKRGKVVYDVKYGPETVVFDEAATERAFRAVSDDGATYILDASEPAVHQLKRGSVLFLYGVALRKVTSLQPSGSNVVVSTTQAQLTDAIRHGEIAWQVPIDFTEGFSSQPPRSRTLSLLDLLVQPAWAEQLPEPSEFEGTIGPFDYELKFVTEASNRIKVHIEFKSTNIDLRGEGYLQNLSSTGKVLIDQYQITEASSKEPFNGKVVFTWIARQTGLVPITMQSMKFRIPASWHFPLILGGLPCMLEITGAVIVHPVLTPNAFTTGEVIVTYNGDAGLSKSSSSGTESEGSGESTQEVEHDTSIFGIGPVAFVVALELPRIELALGVLAPASYVGEFSDIHPKTRSVIAGLAPGSTTAESLMAPIQSIAFPARSLWAFPVTPFFFMDLVTSASAITAGVTGTLPVPGGCMPQPCEKVNLVVALNAGFGGKVNIPFRPFTINGARHSPGFFHLGQHDLNFEPLEVAKTIRKWEFVKYKNGIKCLGDQ